MQVMYDFKCPASGHIQERLVEKGTEKVYCIVCDEFAIRQLTAPPAHFKGKGFYATDYKGK